MCGTAPIRTMGAWLPPPPQPRSTGYPTRQGFDAWFGLPFSHDMRMTVPRDDGFRTRAYYEPKPEYWNVPLMRNDEVIEQPVDHRTLTARYTE